MSTALNKIAAAIDRLDAARREAASASAALHGVEGFEGPRFHCDELKAVAIKLRDFISSEGTRRAADGTLRLTEEAEAATSGHRTGLRRGGQDPP